MVFHLDNPQAFMDLVLENLAPVIRSTRIYAEDYVAVLGEKL
jgi:hypothetical protein